MSPGRKPRSMMPMPPSSAMHDGHLGARHGVHVGRDDRPLQRQVLCEPRRTDRSLPDRGGRRRCSCGVEQEIVERAAVNGGKQVHAGDCPAVSRRSAQDSDRRLQELINATGGVGGGERFLEELRTRARGRRGPSRPRRHKPDTNNTAARPERTQASGEIAAAHAGNHDIGQQQVDSLRLARGEGERVGGIRGRQHGPPRCARPRR